MTSLFDPWVVVSGAVTWHWPMDDLSGTRSGTEAQGMMSGSLVVSESPQR